jgi:uncharacterized protein (TIGR02588 family)
MAPRNKTRKQDKKADGKPALEWAASALGLLILIGLAAILSWDALQQTQALPAVAIERGRIMQSRHGYTVEFVARNDAGATASDVQVEGVLRRDGQVVEVAQSRIDYVPGSSARRGGLFFTRDPSEHELTLRALGYAKP